MVDKEKLTVIRKVSAGVIAGALIAGTAPIVLASILTQGEYIDFPFHQDDCTGYEVTTQSFHIDRMKSGKNEVEAGSPKIEYMPKNEINDLLALSFETYNQYMKQVINGDTKIAREVHYYNYFMDTLTKEEIEKMINQFENGEFQEISRSADFSGHTYDIPDYLLSEELEDSYYYSADLTINTVDYDKTVLITEDKDSFEYNALFSVALSIGAAIGGGVGLLQTMCEEESVCGKKKVKSQH